MKAAPATFIHVFMNIILQIYYLPLVTTYLDMYIYIL